MERLYRTLLVVSTLASSWLALQAVHELGHVLGTWLTGGQVERVILHPLAISRTDVSENHQPLVVAWAGPAVGVALPLILWAVSALTAAIVQRCGQGLAWTLSYFLRFFAGACLVANGLYLGVGCNYRIGDCGDLLRHGAERWQLWLFGAITVPLGFLLWHNLGRHFGLGREHAPVSRRAALAGAAAWRVIVALELLLSGH